MTTEIYLLGDAEAKNRLFPNTFPIPSKEMRQNLVVGDLAKCTFRWRDERHPTERMWVLVTKVVKKGVYEGTLNNTPFSRLLELHTPVSFEAKHILQIEGVS